MVEGRRGLGRGLSALLDEARGATTPERREAAGALDLPIEMVRRNPEQPRREFDATALDELAESIRERGVIQPILVRPVRGSPGEYQIVAGERRWRAAQLAGLHAIPALVREFDELEVMEIALIENIQRADLNALEEARGYVAMTDRFGRGVEAIAKIVGKSRSHVANTVRLTRLPAPVREHLEAGRITAGHARALLDLDEAPEIAARIIAQGLNVRQTETIVRQIRDPLSNGDARKKTPRFKDADTRDLEDSLRDTLGLKVEVRDDGGKGELRIAYTSLEQLDDICARILRGGAVP